jgi:tetratricopeptide (TPR) repeat protein
MIPGNHICLHCGVLRRSLTLVSCLAMAFWGFAHDGPEHDIEELTERIAQEGESADLLLQRAVEYQVIRKSAEAAKDLDRALQLDPVSPAIRRELGRVYFTLGKTNEALKTVSSGLEGSVKGADRGALLMVRADILRARKEYAKALADANDAIQSHPNNVEWYLARSQLQWRLKLARERVAGLEAGIRETGSGVLHGEWIDALIEDGQYALALEKIESELNASRLQSSWLIRRGKVHLLTGKPDLARTDGVAALRELNGRMSSAAVDPSLLVDRGMAYELIGETENARKDYVLARDKGAGDEWLAERIGVLR